MTYFVEGINISYLLEFTAKFEEFRQNLTTEQNKAGAIKSFEYSYEMSWKTLKRILNARGYNEGVATPKSVYRKAADEGFIDNVKIWFHFMDMRNLTSHTYSEKNQDKVLASFPDFSRELQKLITKLKELK